MGWTLLHKGDVFHLWRCVSKCVCVCAHMCEQECACMCVYPYTCYMLCCHYHHRALSCGSLGSYIPFCPLLRAATKPATLTQRTSGVEGGPPTGGNHPQVSLGLACLVPLPWPRSMSVCVRRLFSHKMFVWIHSVTD